MTLCQRRVFASPGMKGRKWKLFSVVCLFFLQTLFRPRAVMRTHLSDIHEFLLVWITAKHGVEQNMDPVEEHVKKTVVTAARETWEIYFSRLFPASVRVINAQRIIITACAIFSFIKPLCVSSVCVQGSVGTGVQVLSVSHSGIKLLKTVKSSAAAPDYFRVLRPYTYEQFVLFLFRKFFLGFTFIFFGVPDMSTLQFRASVEWAVNHGQVSQILFLWLNFWLFRRRLICLSRLNSTEFLRLLLLELCVSVLKYLVNYQLTCKMSNACENLTSRSSFCWGLWIIM